MWRSAQAKSVHMIDPEGGATPGRREPTERARLLEDILGALPLGLSVKASDGALIYANDAATRHGADRLPGRRSAIAMPIRATRTHGADKATGRSKSLVMRSSSMARAMMLRRRPTSRTRSSCRTNCSGAPISTT
jgi:hypothetical protein